MTRVKLAEGKPPIGKPSIGHESANGAGDITDRSTDPRLVRSPIEGRMEQVEVLRDGAFNLRPKRDRLAIFIDGGNLFYATLQLPFEIDYVRLLRHLKSGRQLLRAYFYTGIDRRNEHQQSFLRWMRRHGYRVITKELTPELTLELTQRPDGPQAANLDVEIAVDMMTLAQYCDTLILLSGDGQLAYAVNHISDRGVKVEVIGLRSSTSEHLIRVADRFTDLANLQEQIRQN